jgi:hypothetical protein
MSQLSSLFQTLLRPGGRSLLHLPSKLNVSEGVQLVTNEIFNKNLLPSETELIIVTFGKIYLTGTRISIFQIAQMNQALFNLLVSQPNRIFIIEMATIWGQINLPSDIGHILTISTDYKSIKENTETARFLSGLSSRSPVNDIGPLDLTKYYGQIGYLLCLRECFAQSFDYQGIPVTVKMNDQQYQEYLGRLENEKVLNRSIPYSAIQVTNFLYPETLQRLHNIPRDRRPTITPDRPTSEGGWLTKDILKELEERSPKLSWLISYFQKNPGKHIVWSSFSHSNGVDLIESILQLAGFKTIKITGSDSIRQRYQKIEEFNRQSLILVTNLYAFTGLKDIRSFIIVDQHPYSSIINSYLREIATGGPQNFTTVIFLIAVGPDQQPTIDVLNYKIMAQMLISTETMLNILKTGQLQPNKLDTYQQAFERPTLSLADLQRTIDRTFQKIIFE